MEACLIKVNGPLLILALGGSREGGLRGTDWSYRYVVQDFSMARQYNVVVEKESEGFSSRVWLLSLAITHRHVLLMS